MWALSVCRRSVLGLHVDIKFKLKIQAGGVLRTLLDTIRSPQTAGLSSTDTEIC